MRNLNINKKKIIVLNYLGKTEIVVGGNKTGSFKVSYSAEQMFMGHISGAKGNAQIEMFGTDVNYDKVIVITLKEKKYLGIDENSVFFIDREPTYDTEHLPLYDYKVVRIADTINESAIAVEKVRR